MKFLAFIIFSLLGFSLGSYAQTTPEDIQRSVWVNEAIVATYTFSDVNFLQRQKEIAKYFTAQGWIHYSKALQDSQLPDVVKKKAYSVSAVATMPPEITKKDNQWQAKMPLLVVYSNPNYKQKQVLNVMLTFTDTPTGAGVRGMAITDLQSTISQPPCECVKQSVKAIG